MSDATRILVVDDSALYRQTIQHALRDIDEALVVGIAKNGVEALAKIEALNPDLLTLDVQMPDMDGIKVLHEIKRHRLSTKAIMVSSFTAEGAQVTTDALMEGAFDFILKPSGSDGLENRRQLKQALMEKIFAFRAAHDEKQQRFCRPQPGRLEEESDQPPLPASACRAVVIGTSTGGPEALKIVLPRLPAELAVPVFVVQHMPPFYTSSLARRLNTMCQLEVMEAENGMPASDGEILIAPGGSQLGVRLKGSELRAVVTDDPPENAVRPAVDYLLKSATQVLDGDLLAVIMTGMGRDGMQGCQILKQAGGCVFAQSPIDCVVFGMPKAIIENNLADRVLPLGKIAPGIVRHLNRSRRAAKETS